MVPGTDTKLFKHFIIFLITPKKRTHRPKFEFGFKIFSKLFLPPMFYLKHIFYVNLVKIGLVV